MYYLQIQVWENDMIFKDQDDCSKRLLCELNAMRKEGKVGINCYTHGDRYKYKYKYKHKYKYKGG